MNQNNREAENRATTKIGWAAGAICMDTLTQARLKASMMIPEHLRTQQ